MVRRWNARAGSAICVAVVSLAVAPALAGAETRQFFDSTTLFSPGEEDDLVGPANEFPSTISVSGISGTVTKATVTMFGYTTGGPDQTDMAIVGPNGQQVMLMSDACGGEAVEGLTLTFDDSGPIFLSNNGSCRTLPSDVPVRPSNYIGEDPEPDDFSADGGPAPPFGNSLSAFNGSSPNGAWNLFLLDDTVGTFGFTIEGWGLTLEIDPPPDPPPGPPAPPSDTTAPETKITAGPASKTRNRNATFGFTSTEPNSTFQCRVDDATFAACSSLFDTKVARGRHTFEVRAIDAAGNVDPTPASQGWKVKKKKKR